MWCMALSYTISQPCMSVQENGRLFGHHWKRMSRSMDAIMRKWKGMEGNLPWKKNRRLGIGGRLSAESLYLTVGAFSVPSWTGNLRRMADARITISHNVLRLPMAQAVSSVAGDPFALRCIKHHAISRKRNLNG